MKKIVNYTVRLGIGFLLLTLTAGCDLDYENTNAINPDNVWTDKAMINAFLTDIHGKMMPGWSFGQSADEGISSGGGEMPDYYRGIISVENDGQDLNYENIDKINFFLDKLEGVSNVILSQEDKDRMMGQALFWRAWAYWGKVKVVGGVPLILKPQDVTDRESLFVTRNKTSECITQIIQDLDDAIAYLPDVWDNTNYGRIDKGAAMSFKGKVLMWYASPLFNPGNEIARWENAYQANKSAVEFLQSVGKGLYPDYANIWKDERNQEVIMVNQFYYPDHAYNCGAVRPEPFTQGASNSNQPFLPLLLAYPQKDGSPLEPDLSKLNDPAYNEAYLTNFYTNRDDRFYTTVFCGGTIYPTPDLQGGNRYWCTWVWEEEKYTNMGFQQLAHSSNYGATGFFSLKGVDESTTKSTVNQAAVDWIEIRFAEVLMNYGECANEVGKTEEALQVLYDIRKRAGITAGDGRYGITANGQDAIREAYINERFVEFAFEDKRWQDLRRLKRFDILNNLKYRSAIYTVLKPELSPDNFDWTSDIMNEEVRKQFYAVYVESLDGGDQMYNLDLNHWFYPIKRAELEKNSRLEQNNEWGGMFDPLQ